MKTTTARLVASLRKDPWELLFGFVSLYVAYFQYARVGHRLAGALLCLFLLVSLALSRPPITRSLRGRRLGILLWPFQWAGFLYRLVVAVLILAYARCVAIPFYFLAVPLLIVALVPRVLGTISFNAYLFLLFDLFMALTLCMFTPPSGTTCSPGRWGRTTSTR